jgi:hypothetical protein
MNKHIFSVALLIFLCPISGFSEDWTPRPTFSVDGGGYQETLIFMSGISYGLTYSNVELKSKSLDNFYCYSGVEGISSKVLFDIVNSKLAGNHSSEEVLEVLMVGLKEKFPCENKT